MEEVALDFLARQRRGPRPLRELNKDIDRQFELLIQQCLAYDPRERPPSAESLAISLHRQKKLPRRAKRWVRNHPLRIAGIGVSLLVCTFLSGLWFTLRDPVEIRLYKQGLLDLQHGQPSQAVNEFNEALRLAPDDMTIHLACAKAYHQQGNYPHALDEYDRVYAFQPSGEIAALQGYCMSKKKYHRDAILKYQQAIKAGYQPFSLWNNLGFSAMQSGQFIAAEKYLRNAILLNPRSSTAWHNLIKLMYNQTSRNEMSYQEVVGLANDVANVANPTPELYVDLAALESRMVRHDPRFIQNVFEHLEHAISLGADPQWIVKRSYFAHLQKQTKFSALSHQKPGVRTSQISDGLIDPL